MDTILKEWQWHALHYMDFIIHSHVAASNSDEQPYTRLPALGPLAM
jgi:hypothetical protein